MIRLAGRDDSAHHDAMRIASICLMALLAMLAGCGERDPDVAPPVILAAASLQGPVEDITRLWVAEGHPAPRISFSASGAAARQILAGAPADIFLSADRHWSDELVAAGKARDTDIAELTRNRLVLAVRKGGDDCPAGDFAAKVASLGGIGPGRVAIADPDSAPAGEYARQALKRLGRWEALQPRLAMAENVRAALTMLERRTVDRAIVYASDVTASSSARICAVFPPDSHEPIVYTALLVGSGNREAARFRAFLIGHEAERVFARHGFGA